MQRNSVREFVGEVAKPSVKFASLYTLFRPLPS